MLAVPFLSFMTVAAADRKVVCMHGQYSNIYVSYQARFGDLERMYASLRDGRATDFQDLASRHRVTHVIQADETGFDACRLSPRDLPPERFQLAFAEGRYRVFRVKQAGKQLN